MSVTFANAHALAIGIAAYRHVPPLPAIDDANAIAGVLADRCGYAPANVRLLRDEEATGEAVFAALAELAARTDADSTVLVYFSGHGGRIATGVHAGEYLLPVDAVYPTDESLAASAISGATFTNALAAIPARKVVVVFDCCHAGGVGQPRDIGSPPLEVGLSDQYYDALTAGRGRVIFASSRRDEYSYVPDGSRFGLFTRHLLDGLQGAADGDDDYVRIFDLFEYVQPRVTTSRRDQHPVFKAEVEDNFAVAARLLPPAAPPVDEEFRYDAYISYVATDAAWVWETLVPELERGGLRIAVSDDIAEPGVARVVNVERGITRAKRTVIVLSNAYLDDHMADFENVLAQTIGVDEGSYRLLPVIVTPLDKARLPSRLAMLTPVDFTRAGRADRQLRRLVDALHG